MTLPESTSGRGRQLQRSAVEGGVVGLTGVPAAVDDADPGSGQDADCVRVVVSAGAGLGVDVGGPGAFVAAVVGEGGQGSSEPFVAGPAEVHGVLLARGFGHG